MKLTLTILLSVFIQVAFSQSEKPFILKGNELYKQQVFDKAAEEYKKATEKNNKSAEAQYNLGNALYKIKKPDEAASAYEGAFENTADKSLKSRAAYNKGVLFSRQNKLPESIQWYKEALKFSPEDNEARENLQKALNELRKQQPPPPPKNNKEKKQQQKQQQNPPPQNRSKYNKKQVEQMLNTLRQQEKKLQQNLQNKQKSGGYQNKDW